MPSVSSIVMPAKVVRYNTKAKMDTLKPAATPNNKMAIGTAPGLLSRAQTAQ
jgi:hypothetical protein